VNIRTALISALALCLLAGCGYRLGPTGGRAAGAQSLEIAPFTNETREARVLDALTTALSRRTQEDGTFKLATRRDGDLVLSGVITNYRRLELSFEPGDLASVRDYQLVMTVHATVVERATGRVILEGETSGQTTIRVGTDLASAERQAMPLLADDLARNLIGKLADGDW
jgi:outer membrane lipopolysaccharide assembly protein LptE/RlpB